jgi:MFS family permease
MADDHAKARHPMSPFSPLAHPTYRAIWLTNNVANLGAMIQVVGASWLLASLSASAATVSLVQAAVGLPVMLLSLPAGAVADTGDRRGIMLIAQGVILATSLLLALGAVLGIVGAELLLAATFVIGCAAAFKMPAWLASVGQILPRSELPAAIALNGIGFNIMRSIGPGLGGAIVAVAGVTATFLVNAATQIGELAAIARWRVAKAEHHLPPERIGAAMMAGLRYVVMAPEVSAVLWRSLSFGGAASVSAALLPVLVRDRMGGDPLLYGALLSAFGIGALAAGLRLPLLRARHSGERLVRVAFALTLVAALAAAFLPLAAVMIVAMLVAGAGWVIAFSTFTVTIQLSAPRWVEGRAIALYQMAAFAGIAAGSVTWGMAADAIGLSQAFIGAAIAAALGIVMGFVRAIPAAEAADDAPIENAVVARLPGGIMPRSGPVVISTAYRIAESDLLAFLAATTELRRTRRRNGAHRWTLLRDLDDAEVWIERFHCPTWLDYLRHEQRRTLADQQAIDAVSALHRGPRPPVVRRRVERTLDRPPAETGDSIATPTRPM